MDSPHALFETLHQNIIAEAEGHTPFDFTSGAPRQELRYCQLTVCPVQSLRTDGRTLLALTLPKHIEKHCGKQSFQILDAALALTGCAPGI